MPGRIEQAAEPLLHRVGQRAIHDHPSVQDEALLLRGRTGDLRRADQAPDRGEGAVRGIADLPRDLEQLSLEFASEHLDDPSSGIVGGGEVQEGPTVETSLIATCGRVSARLRTTRPRG